MLDSGGPGLPPPGLGHGLEYIFSPAMINKEVTGFFLECCAEARHNYQGEIWGVTS